MAKIKEIIIISGRSGRTTAARALEDIGFHVVDNFPPQLLGELLSLASTSLFRADKIAIIIDVREKEFLGFLPKKWLELDLSVSKKSLFYLDASEETLIERYQETKRRHPLDDGCGIKTALKNEHEILKPVKSIATKEIFTDRMTSHELRVFIQSLVNHEQERKLDVTLMSFGYKYGVPYELDLCFDVRFLKNPYYEPELRYKTGLDREVFEFVMTAKDTQVFFNKLREMVVFLHPLYELEGKSRLTIAIGCTGGQHRSIALTEALHKNLSDKIKGIRVMHRDLARHTL